MPTAAPFLGIILLDTRFPRPPGDIGNPLTFERAGIAVRLRRVIGASPERVVRDADQALVQPFVDAAVALAAEGAALVSTSCGFLAACQMALAAAVEVPVVSSSLLQCKRFARPGIVTFDVSALGQAVLRAAGVAPGTPIEGIDPSTSFHRSILGNLPSLDLHEAEAAVVDAALRLVRRHPDVEDLVLECTNMPPYRDAVARATGRRVHDLETLLIDEWARRMGARSDPAVPP